MSGPQETNEQAQMVNGWIDKFMKWLTDLAIKVIAGKIPWLNIWPLNHIFRSIVERNVKPLTVFQKQIATQLIIDHQQKKKVESAVEARDQLAEAINSQDEEAIRKANEEFNKKYADLIHYGGHANVGR